MAKQVQLRRGSASDHTTFTGAVGELTYVSDDKTLRIHDGSTASGITVGTGVINVKNYGATGDGSTDDTAAIQAAATAATSGQALFFPANSSGTTNYKISTKITMVSGVSIKFESKKVTVLCVGCDGFDYPVGSIRTSIESGGISQSVRHTTTPNTYFAIRFQGDTGNRPYYNTIRNMFFDGFYEPINAQWSWDLVITGNQAVFCGRFLNLSGICANSFISENNMGGNDTLLIIGDGTNTIQGITISRNFLDSMSLGVPILATGASFCRFTENICDFVGAGTAVLLQSSGSVVSGSWIVSNNYIAFGANGDEGIRILNSTSWGSTLNTGNVIDSNAIFAYTSYTLTRGILIDGTVEDLNQVTNNSVKADTYDCDLDNSTNTTVMGNRWLGTGFYSTTDLAIYVNNIGTIISSEALHKNITGGSTHYYGTAAPASGTYVVGDIVWDLTPTASGYIGWVCTTAGTPGTWKTFGSISS